jgi:hypothetical protein
MILAANHPRYTVAVVVMSFTTILLAANVLFGPTSPYSSLGKLQGPPSLPIGEQIRLSEADYQTFLDSRKALIQKYGPSKEEVES